MNQALQTALPSTGNNLLGFDIDLCYALVHTNYFSHIKTKRTGEQQNMIVATCRLKPKYKCDGNVEAVLRTLWQEQVGYDYFKAHDIQHDGQEVRLRFVTLSGNTAADYYVTGTIIVSGAVAP